VDISGSFNRAYNKRIKKFRIALNRPDLHKDMSKKIKMAIVWTDLSKTVYEELTNILNSSAIDNNTDFWKQIEEYDKLTDKLTDPEKIEEALKVRELLIKDRLNKVELITLADKATESSANLGINLIGLLFIEGIFKLDEIDYQRIILKDILGKLISTVAQATYPGSEIVIDIGNSIKTIATARKTRIDGASELLHFWDDYSGITHQACCFCRHYHKFISNPEKYMQESELIESRLEEEYNELLRE
jgi:hypothetical protein